MDRLSGSKQAFRVNLSASTKTSWYFWSILYHRWARCSVPTAIFFLAKGRPIRLGLDGLASVSDRGLRNIELPSSTLAA